MLFFNALSTTLISATKDFTCLTYSLYSLCISFNINWTSGLFDVMLFAPNHFLIVDISSSVVSKTFPVLSANFWDCIAIALLPIAKCILCNNFGLANSSSLFCNSFATLINFFIDIDSKSFILDSSFSTLANEFKYLWYLSSKYCFVFASDLFTALEL